MIANRSIQSGLHSRINLTEYSDLDAGCGCKLGPTELERLLSDFPGFHRSERDDGALLRISDLQSIVMSVDFLTPIVDDPYEFGYIAAMHAMSDIYAMGGRPIVALHMVAWPDDEILLKSLEDVLKGSSDAVRSCGAYVGGGHTIRDNSPKFGLSVTGMVANSRVLTLTGAETGDVLVLTKPLGTGVLSNAAQRRLLASAPPTQWINSMKESNAKSSEVATSLGVRCATDVSGFGLIGHLASLLVKSEVGAEVIAASVPVYPGAAEAIIHGAVTGGGKRNQVHFEAAVHWGPDVLSETKTLLFDPQTSGGLLMCVKPQYLRELSDSLSAVGVEWSAIGDFSDRVPPGIIKVT